MSGSNGLSERAMLVDVDIKRWYPVKVDQDISKDASIKHGTNGRYHKQLIAKNAMKKLTNLRNQIRDTHYFLTAPWENEGPRILSNDAYFKYTDQIRRLIDEYGIAADEFEPLYPWYVEQERLRIEASPGGRFNPDDYPAPSEIRSRFSVDVKIMPIRDAADFRVQGIGEDEVRKIREQITRERDAILEQAMGDVWARLRDVIQKAVDGLKAYSVNQEGKVEHAFRDSLVQNIRDLLDVVPLLNISKDPELDKYAQLIRKHVAAVDPDALRDSDVTREAVAAKAEAILKKMKSFGL